MALFRDEVAVNSRQTYLGDGLDIGIGDSGRGLIIKNHSKKGIPTKIEMPSEKIIFYMPDTPYRAKETARFSRMTVTFI